MYARSAIRKASILRTERFIHLLHTAPSDSPNTPRWVRAHMTNLAMVEDELLILAKLKVVDMELEQQEARDGKCPYV
jgi:hypothetical protein